MSFVNSSCEAAWLWSPVSAVVIVVLKIFGRTPGLSEYFEENICYPSNITLQVVFTRTSTKSTVRLSGRKN